MPNGDKSSFFTWQSMFNVKLSSRHTIFGQSKQMLTLILIILVKACLFNTYPSSISGNEEKHIEKPLSFFWISFIYFLIVHNFSELFLFRNWVILFLIILSFELFLYLLSWLVIFVRRLSVSKQELSYSLPHSSGNVGIPSPPSFVSKDNFFLKFEGAIPPVMDRINSVYTT